MGDTSSDVPTGVSPVTTLHLSSVVASSIVISVGVGATSPFAVTGSATGVNTGSGASVPSSIST